MQVNTVIIMIPFKASTVVLNECCELVRLYFFILLMLVLSLVFSVVSATFKLSTVILMCNAGHIGLSNCGMCDLNVIFHSEMLMFLVITFMNLSVCYVFRVKWQ